MMPTPSVGGTDFENAQVNNVSLRLVVVVSGVPTRLTGVQRSKDKFNQFYNIVISFRRSFFSLHIYFSK